MPFIFLDEKQRTYLEWWAKAHNAPDWFIKALEREDPKRNQLPVTYWRGRQK
jgi:hypothetical protein